MSESKFNSKEIERERRHAASKHKHIDYEELKAKQQLLQAARTDTPEQFEARLRIRGIDPASSQGVEAMKAYRLIQRAQQR